eukprot:3701810-Rhodomonas_salina.2
MIPTAKVVVVVVVVVVVKEETRKLCHHHTPKPPPSDSVRYMNMRCQANDQAILLSALCESPATDALSGAQPSACAMVCDAWY